MDRNLALEVVRVTEAAALASARLMGRGDVAAVDQAATEAMRRAFDAINFDGVVVIGEGAEGEVPALYVGERIGGGGTGEEIDVAVDALEGATVCATGGANALSIIVIAEHGKIIACPDTYMNKLAVGPEGKGVVDLDCSPTENLRALAEAKGLHVEALTAVILDRPRHRRLVEEVRAAGARVHLLADGDLASAVATGRLGSGIDILMGVGGAHQGVLAAAAVAAMGGEFQGRFQPRSEDEVIELRNAGLTDLNKRYSAVDLVGDNVMFAATGVTGGHLLAGVRYFRGGATTNSVVMRSQTRTVRWIEAVHHFDFKPEY
jgi:fructose-1,6-bisphosphatase II